MSLTIFFLFLLLQEDNYSDDDTIRESLNNKPANSSKHISKGKPTNKRKTQKSGVDNTESDEDNDETISDQVILSIKDVSVSISHYVGLACYWMIVLDEFVCQRF